MCCRYYIDPDSEVEPYIRAAERSPLKERLERELSKPMLTSGEVRPTDLVPVIAPDKSRIPTVFPMFWGFHLPDSKVPIINARVETAREKVTFRESWENRRCAIPASYYFEWEHLKTDSGKKKTGEKFRIQPEGNSIVFFAGLYRIEVIKGVKVPVFTILTTEAEEEVRFIHDRMPVMLAKDDADRWIRMNWDTKGVNETFIPLVAECIHCGEKDTLR